jgi:hypothetical protein
MAKHQLSRDRLDEAQLRLQVRTDAHADAFNKHKRSERQVAVIMHRMFAHGIYSTALTPLDDLDDLGLRSLDRDDNDGDTGDTVEVRSSSSFGQPSSAWSTPTASRSILNSCAVRTLKDCAESPPQAIFGSLSKLPPRAKGLAKREPSPNPLFSPCKLVLSSDDLFVHSMTPDKQPNSMVGFASHSHSSPALTLHLVKL